MGNSCQTCNKNILAKILTSVLLLMSYLYKMYSTIDSEKSLIYKIINGVHYTAITIINFVLLYISKLSNSKTEQKENVGEREENKEEYDVLKEGANLVKLFSNRETIIENLKRLEANGNEEAGRVLRSIEELIKPKENIINN